MKAARHPIAAGALPENLRYLPNGQLITVDGIRIDVLADMEPRSHLLIDGRTFDYEVMNA